ncbi:hypothetical protein [Pseudomonas syringae]|uniref:DNA-binding transcriptional regulator n=1 Tax=Pseudomonas syringae pv. actinidiae TaxID=103796 RepID=A0A2V0QDY8_PSESF|nr:hypothetical protein [Pseudomonas syringae]EPM91092.1 hypothetical protein A259_39436 [Pseudomonas syringae pv. actinidiae ICMP 19070]NVL26830.1 hypothetical protein [Pseudomonas syringae pv. actinidiae]NVL30696.1 hypothetical protein [Pseudomonas syringae pv. actinidiae]BBI43972.1 hypothetical protein KPSA1B_102705 [Pseudomonas syringae pv. actinidiae]GBH11229.1 DNA-binding transcriptional regulator [Pseudomonas syringae pv. actinidiae]
MKVRALWGFKGIQAELKNATGQARAGEEFDVSDEYGHTLVGKGLAAEVDGKTAPKTNKQAKPEENK